MYLQEMHKRTADLKLDFLMTLLCVMSSGTRPLVDVSDHPSASIFRADAAGLRSVRKFLPHYLVSHQLDRMLQRNYHA
jgi:hypothetical protein